MEAVFSSAKLAAVDQFDGFCEAVRKSVAQVDPRRRGGGPFAGQIKQQSVEHVEFTEILCDPLVVERSPEQIEENPDRCFYALIQIAGQTLVQQTGRSLLLEPGDFTLIDNVDPYSLASSRPIHRLLVRMSYPDFDSRVGDSSRIPATHFSIRGGSAPLALELLQLIVRDADRLSSSEMQIFSNHTLDVLTSAIQSGTALKYRTADAPRSTLIARIKEFVGANLSAPNLLPAGIAATHGISTRYLHKLFNASGQSVCEWIRERRLVTCYLDLCNPSFANLTITEIALRRGFNDASHFSRTFRKHFDRTPRSVRSQTRRTSSDH
jgi:AraC-like DNA-binding protein